MSYIFYVFGVIGVLLAGFVITRVASSEAGALGMTFAITYGGSVFVAAMTFFAIGRALDYLAVIAKNSRHLKLLDPDLAAAHAEKKERGFLGFGRKEPTL